MKYFLAVILCAALLPGCIGPKRYARYVKAGLSKTDTLAAAVPGVYIKSRIPEGKDPVVTVIKGPHFFIPAIFYWGVKQSFSCDLNPDIPVRIFDKACSRYAMETGLAGRLNGRRLEITINSLPEKFVYSQDIHTVIFAFFYVILGHNGILPVSNDLDVSYKIYDGGSVTKQGNIIITDMVKRYENNNKSTKKLTRIYLHRYEESLERMSRRCMDKLAMEI